MEIALPVIGKFSTARSVWTPKYAAAGTARSPSRSCSIRISSACMPLLRRLAHRFEDGSELRAHCNPERPAGREPPLEPLLVEARELTRFGELLERVLDQPRKRRVVLAKHDPVRVVRQIVAEHDEVAGILGLGCLRVEQRDVAGPRIDLAARQRGKRLVV